jgi:prevent-host-death family protein
MFLYSVTQGMAGGGAWSAPDCALTKHSIHLKVSQEVYLMESILGVEEARRVLGALVSKVNLDRGVVVITRRAREKAVLMNYDEYTKLRELASEATGRKASDALARIRASVREAAVPESVIGEVIDEVRSR